MFFSNVSESWHRSHPGKMKDNLYSTEEYFILYLGEHGGDVIMFVCI